MWLHHIMPRPTSLNTMQPDERWKEQLLQSVPAAEPQAPPRRMVLEEEVLKDYAPFSRATLYREIDEGKFPPPVYISANRRAWFADELRTWQDALRPRGRDQRPQNGGR
jgi:prophage regulatory protein